MQAILRLLAFVALTITLGAQPSLADGRVGTAAWSTQTLTLRTGPGMQYEAIGNITAESAIRVLRCQLYWCNVTADGAATGWTNIGKISFGTSAKTFPNNTPRYLSGGPGEACFFTEANYKGDYFCVRDGRVLDDLSRIGLDNRFASVTIQGNISVAACRDRFFRSYCERIIASQPRLNEYLFKSLSAIRAY
jgi:uncharacterized protein YraI